MKEVEKVPIVIKEFSGIDRANEPVTVGVPLPRGNVKKGDPLTLINSSGEALPLQVAPLAFWPDQSVKWMLLDFQASVRASEVSQYHLRIGTDPGGATKAISVDRYDNGLRVETGVTTYYLDGKIFLPFSRVISNGIDVVDGSSSEVALIDGEGDKYEPVVEKLSVETKGSLRTAIKIEGAFCRENRRLARFVSRLHFLANKSFVRMEFTLWNSRRARHTGGLWDLGDPGSIFFKDLSICITLNSSHQPSAISYQLNENSVPVDHQQEPECYELTAKSYELNGGSHLLIYQDSSGGENWQSHNHVNRNGEVKNSFRGYTVYSNEKVIREGFRASPTLSINDDEKGISGATQYFWQNFPKALEAKGNHLIIRLFPKYFSDHYELQGGEQKTHIVFLDFSGDPDSLRWIQKPLIPRSTPEWYSKSRAVPYLACNAICANEEYERLIKNVIRGENTFFDKREVIDEYGWRNFGDIYADHEAVGNKGTAPLVSHYNNQYDQIYSFVRQYMSESDLSWYYLMDNLAHHLVDIDIYHTDQDREEYNGGMFWHTNHYLDAATCTHRSVSREHLKSIDSKSYGGGPGIEHNYATGLLFHFYLTGDFSSKEAVLGLANWVMHIIDGSNTFLGALYNFKKKLSIWAKVFKGEKIRSESYPFTRGSGNLINTLLDAYSLTYEESYIRKSEEIIRGCIHPRDNIDSRGLVSDPEGKWSYTVFLQALGKFLELKCEIEEIDYMYCYTKDSLLHYAEWMLANEYPYLEKPELLEFPNETWAGQDLRKSSVFYYAAKYCNSDLRESYLEKARFFFSHSIQELYEFETSTLVRPIALILQNGAMHFYFLENPHERGPDIESKCDFRGHAEFLSSLLIANHVIEETTRVLLKTSIKKEIHWLKCRMNRHI